MQFGSTRPCACRTFDEILDVLTRVCWRSRLAAPFGPYPGSTSCVIIGVGKVAFKGQQRVKKSGFVPESGPLGIVFSHIKSFSGITSSELNPEALSC